MRAFDIVHVVSNDQFGTPKKQGNLASNAVSSKSYHELKSDIAVQIERDKSGLINYNHYEKRAKSLHAQAIISAFTSICLFIWGPFLK